LPLPPAASDQPPWCSGQPHASWLGLWAAEQLGLSGDEAQAYAVEVIKADLAEPGDEDVVRKVRSDFDAKGVEQSDHQIRSMIDEMMAEAVRQIESEARA
jgi:hypothetical protein